MNFLKKSNFFDVKALLQELCESNSLSYELYNDFLLQENSAVYDLLKHHKSTFDRAFPLNKEESGLKYRQLSFSKIRSSQNFLADLKRQDSLLFEKENVILLEDKIGPCLGEIIRKLSHSLGRVRLAVLMANSEIQPHIDHGGQNMMRLHLPLITNENCFFFSRQKGQTQKKHLPADGSMYTFNVGKRHWVINEGNEPRLHLIIDCFDPYDVTGFETF